MVLLLCEEGTTTTKQLTLVICTNLTHLNIMLSFTFKVLIANNKMKCIFKNEQTVLLLGEEDTPTTKQLMLVFALT